MFLGRVVILVIFLFFGIGAVYVPLEFVYRAEKAVNIYRKIGYQHREAVANYNKIAVNCNGHFKKANKEFNEWQEKALHLSLLTWPPGQPPAKLLLEEFKSANKTREHLLKSAKCLEKLPSLFNKTIDTFDEQRRQLLSRSR